jgi:hypothetical protein
MIGDDRYKVEVFPGTPRRIDVTATGVFSIYEILELPDPDADAKPELPRKTVWDRIKKPEL